MEMCPCGSGKLFLNCCESFIKGASDPDTAEQLMRSRYTAYVVKAIDYLVLTTHPAQRKYYSKKSLLSWANACHWKRLQINYTTSNQVVFTAVYADNKGNLHEHREQSTFVFENGRWYYLEGKDF